MASTNKSNAKLPRLRVRVALRSRESRSGGDDLYAQGEHTYAAAKVSHSTDESRLCILRRRSGNTYGPPRLIAGGFHVDTVGGNDELAIVGLGMRAERAAASTRSQRSTSRSIETAVQTAFIAVEGLSTAAVLHSATANERPASHATAAVPHSSPSPATTSQYSDAHLTQQLSELIAAELLGDCPPPSASTAISSSSIHKGEGSGNAPTNVRPREVLTFPAGPQGSGKTSFLLGSVQQRSGTTPAQSSSVPTHPTKGGLFGAVLDRVFTTASGQRLPTVAVSVVEVRDAAPLQHPSILRRPRETVDLLSGQLLQREGGGHISTLSEKGGGRQDDSFDHTAEDNSGDSSFSSASRNAPSRCPDQPTDIPAACYVQVTSAAEATGLLFTALLSSAAWQPCPDLGRSGVVDACADRTLNSPFPLPSLLHPAGLPRDEKTSHLSITVLVGCSPHHARGEGVAAAPSVGIWKLWDLSGPSTSCGYHPYRHSDEESDDKNRHGVHPQRHSGKRGMAQQGRAKTHQVAEDSMEGEVRPVLPWCNRYSLPSLTHTCLVAFGCSLGQRAASDTSLVHLDAAALQIAASTVASCSLVVPVCTVVAEAAADEVNSEVLRCASGWAAYSLQLEAGAVKEGADGFARAWGRTCGEENAVAAQRVLENYTVPFAEFVRERLFLVSRSDVAATTECVVTHAGDGNAKEGAHPVMHDAPSTAERSQPVVAASTTRVVEAELSIDADASAFPATGVASGGGRATPPLSINITASEEDQTAALRTPARGEVADSASVDGRATAAAAAVSTTEYGDLRRPDRLADASHRTPLPERPSTNLVRTPQRDGDEGAATTTTDTTPAGPLTASAVRVPLAAMCAAGAVAAEEARLHRFQRLFDTESFSFADEHAWTSHAVETLNDSDDTAGGCSLPTDAETSGGPSEGGPRSLHRPPNAHHTPTQRKGSPPSVICTGLRAPPAEPSLTSSGAVQPAVVNSPAEAAHKEGEEESLVCDPQELRFDPSELPLQQAGRHDVSTLTSGSVTGPREDGKQTGTHPAAAVEQFLKPYCEQLITVYEEMRREVAVWKATEAASLHALAELAERHTRDVQTLSELLHRTSPQAENPAYDGVVLSSIPAAASDSAASALAATSSLIFQQLVASEEKVTWLEKQLVQWRQRTHEVSTLMQNGALEEEETSALADHHHPTSDKSSAVTGALDSGPGAHTSVLSESGSRVNGEADTTDPTRRCVVQAQHVLHRLLQRCGRAYAAAQQRSTRWQEQLAQERAAKSALMDRVLELERELAEYRCHRQTALSTTPLLSKSLEETKAGVSSYAREREHHLGSARGSTLATAGGTFPYRDEGAHHVPNEAMASNQGSRGAEEDIGWSVSAATCATPTPVSPIRSPNDTALSLPSRCDDHCCHGVPSLPTTPVMARGNYPMASSTASSAPPSAAVVPSRLAALLCRAVSSCDGNEPLVQKRKGTALQVRSLSSADGHAGLFDIRVGPASSVADTAVCDADSSGERGAVGLPRSSSLSPVTSSLSPSLASAAAPCVDGARANGVRKGTTDVYACTTGRGDEERPVLSPHNHVDHAASVTQADHQERHSSRSSSPPSSDVRWAVPSLSSEPQGRGNSEARHGESQDNRRASQSDVRGSSARLMTLPRRLLAAQSDYVEAPHDINDDDHNHGYPTTALQRLQQAAAQLAADAVRLTRLDSTKSDSGGNTVGSASQLLRLTLKEPGRRVVSLASDTGRNAFTVREARSSEGEGGHHSTTPLYQSMDQLRSASLAVQREAREAAEREKAYLSTILFSPNSTPLRNE
jgi:hypothetical protein